MPDTERLKLLANSAISELRRFVDALEEDERAAAQLNEIPPGSASAYTKQIQSPPNASGAAVPADDNATTGDTVRLSGGATLPTTATGDTPKSNKPPKDPPVT